MGIFDLFFDKYTKIHGTKCILKKKEVLKLCNNGVRLDSNRTRYTIEKIDFDEDFINRFRKRYVRNNLGKFHRSISPYIPYLVAIRDERMSRPPQYKYLDMTLDEMKTIVMEFYRDINTKYINRHDWVSYFEDLKNDPRFFVDEHEPFGDNGGNNSVSVKDSGLILTLNPANNLSGLATIAHEFGHLLSQSSREKREDPKVDCLAEIESLFMETVFVDWLEKNEKFSQNQINQYWLYSNNGFVTDCKELITENEVVYRLGGEISKSKFKHIAKDIKGHKNEQELLCKMINVADDGQKLIGPYVFRYVVGRAIAFTLFEEYKQNPQETMQKFDDYLRCRCEISSLDEAGEMLLGKNYKRRIMNCLISPERQQKIAEERRQYFEGVLSTKEKN